MNFKTKTVAVFVAMFMLLSFFSIGYAENNTSIEVGTVSAGFGETVKIPIQISNNPGICTMTLYMQYDSNLKLAKLEKGDILKKLTFTPSGDLVNNPVKLVWEGTDSDNSDGVVVYATFITPKISGNYNISLSYDVDEICDGSMKPIEISLQSGIIKVNEYQETQNPDDYSRMTISVGRVGAKVGETVTVPIRIDKNSGICATTIQVQYDSNLVLNSVKRGEALKSLAFTPPGSLVYNNIKFLWDGTNADNTDGVIAYLTFTAPDKYGVYPIIISYEEDDIIDGNTEPVACDLRQGKITVGNSVTAEIGGKTVKLICASGYSGGVVLTAFYDSCHRLLSVAFDEYSPDTIIVTENKNAKFAKVMWFEDFEKIKPLTDAQMIKFN